MSTSLTYYFNEIFPTYENWKEFSLEVGCVDFDDPEQSEFDKYCFTILTRHFSHSNIRYYDKDAFLLELANVYQAKFRQFLKQKQLIDKLYNLTEDEILELSQQITNMANNPNDVPDDPKKPLKYLSAQTYQVMLNNKLRGYVEALNNIPTLSVYKFFKADTPGEMGFEDLFMNVQPNNLYLFKGENEDE